MFESVEEFRDLRKKYNGQHCLLLLRVHRVPHGSRTGRRGDAAGDHRDRRGSPVMMGGGPAQ
jgi:hypothetical protein